MPIPVVVMNTPSPLPRSTTLVSPVTTGTPAAAAARFMDRTTRQRSSIGRPSSRMKPAESATGRAPHIATSFTVPWTASEPMSPPGKKIGLMTNESVEKAIRPPGTSSSAPSWSSERAGLSKAGTKIFSISICDIRPPPPCARVTVG